MQNKVLIIREIYLSGLAPIGKPHFFIYWAYLVSEIYNTSSFLNLKKYVREKFSFPFLNRKYTSENQKFLQKYTSIYYKDTKKNISSNYLQHNTLQKINNITNFSYFKRIIQPLKFFFP